LDLGCVRHNADYALSDPNWLHRKIKLVAGRVVGVDYLPQEVEKLKRHDYQVVLGDVTKPLDIHQKFDVIVAGDLLEHLANFEGFFDNCTRLLKPGGELIISTPNPFYVQEFHYVAFKESFLINPEHTCWIDPQALSQLSIRFGFVIDEISFIRSSWKLKSLICETEMDDYDILNDIWTKQPTIASRIKKRLAAILFEMFYLPYRVLSGTDSALVRHGDYLAVLKKSKDFFAT